MTELLTRENFAGCLGEIFHLCPDHPEGFDLVIELVSELKTGNGQESFTVYFRGPSEKWAPQATYPLAHERLGRMEIFLVPVERDEKGVLYEALFNRLTTL